MQHRYAGMVNMVATLHGTLRSLNQSINHHLLIKSSTYSVIVIKHVRQALLFNALIIFYYCSILQMSAVTFPLSRGEFGQNLSLSSVI